MFPVAWYPDTTPANEEKWKIPSCVGCNAAYGRLEQDFLTRVAMCLDPDDPACSGVVEKVMKSLDPSLASTPRERSARLAKRRRIISDLMAGDKIPTQSTYPGMGERWGRERHEQIAIRISATDCRRITAKIVRGLFFLQQGKLLEPPFLIQHFAAHEDRIPDVMELLRKHGSTHARPPGLIVRWVLVPEDHTSSLFEITFWGRFKSYATVVVSAGEGAR